MFGARSNLVRYSKHFINSHRTTTTRRRRFCNSTSQDNNKQLSQSSKNGKVSDIRQLEAYRDLDNLDFMKATQIYLAAQRKPRKFGIDFHLVQLFFALMPSLAVYLVALYARSEMRKMDAARELRRKAEEEKKAKELEAAAALEREARYNEPEFLEVKERLKALEETLKEIVVEIKKQPSEEKSESADQSQDKVDPNSKSDDSHVTAKNHSTTQEAKSEQLRNQDNEKRGSQEDRK